MASSMFSKRQARRTAPSFSVLRVESKDIRKSNVVINEAKENMLAVTERTTERMMREVSLRDRIDNRTLCRMNGANDIVLATIESKIR